MVQKKFIIVLIFSSFLLMSCNKEPLITQSYQQMNVYIGEELVFKTEEKSVIEETLEEINTSRRDTTHDLDLPSPIGSIVLKNTENELGLSLFEGGGITINEYYVYTEYDY